MTHHNGDCICTLCLADREVVLELAREAARRPAAWWKIRLEPRSGRWVYFVPPDDLSPIEAARKVLGVGKFMRRCQDFVKLEGDPPADLMSIGKPGGIEVFHSPST